MKPSGPAAVQSKQPVPLEGVATSLRADRKGETPWSLTVDTLIVVTSKLALPKMATGNTPLLFTLNALGQDSGWISMVTTVGTLVLTNVNMGGVVLVPGVKLICVNVQPGGILFSVKMLKAKGVTSWHWPSDKLKLAGLRLPKVVAKPNVAFPPTVSLQMLLATVTFTELTLILLGEKTAALAIYVRTSAHTTATAKERFLMLAMFSYPFLENVTKSPKETFRLAYS